MFLVKKWLWFHVGLKNCIQANHFQFYVEDGRLAGTNDDL